MLLQNLLERHKLQWPAREELKTLQVNMGNLCNMTCAHCHVNAGPRAKEVMTEEIASKVISFLFKYRIKTLDLTGGAPEMAPPFRHLVMTAKNLVDEIIVRCNLTVIFEEGMDDLPAFYRSIGAHLVCSLPCYTAENVDRQRGTGTFKKSIAALMLLNEEGYGSDPALKLDLVYNPGGSFLPGKQDELEKDYRVVLKDQYDISFNNLITITNMPINRFNAELEKGDGTNPYLSLLADSFNPAAVDGIMCRSLVSVGWDGRIYDCDFNQALDIPILGKKGEPLSLGDFSPELLSGIDVISKDHCLACVAGEGSSCSGALV
ncbi:MAG: arsenosugar biosynthesis radical SAM protein ArsS [Proteobacteria bacterium]|nr:arsenosugar biosynthesis radical SAM protein ArsS [Pseudomonadota bacterium]